MGDTLRQRQVDALFYSTNPAETYTNERARAVFAYVLRLYFLQRKLSANAEKGEDDNPQKPYGSRARREKQKTVALMSRKARERITARQRAEAEASAEHERLRERLGDVPRDMDGKTFADLETIIFGDASPEAVALDSRWDASGAGEQV